MCSTVTSVSVDHKSHCATIIIIIIINVMNHICDIILAKFHTYKTKFSHLKLSFIVFKKRTQQYLAARTVNVFFVEHVLFVNTPWLYVICLYQWLCCDVCLSMFWKFNKDFEREKKSDHSTHLVWVVFRWWCASFYATESKK